MGGAVPLEANRHAGADGPQARRRYPGLPRHQDGSDDPHTNKPHHDPPPDALPPIRRSVSHPVGTRFAIGDHDAEPDIGVVGLAGDVRPLPQRPARPLVYLAHRQERRRRPRLVLRSDHVAGRRGARRRSRAAPSNAGRRPHLWRTPIGASAPSPPKPVTVVRPTSTAACRCRRFPTGWRPRARPVAFAGRGESGRRRTASCRSRRAPIRGCSRLESAMPSKHGPLAGAARGLVGGGPGWLVDEIEAHRRGWGDQGRPAVRSLTRAPTGIPRRAPGAARGCRPERSVPPPPYSEPEPLVGKHGGKEHPALRLQFIGRRNQLHLGLVKQRRHYQRQLSLREPAAGAVVNPDAERRKHTAISPHTIT